MQILIRRVKEVLFDHYEAYTTDFHLFLPVSLDVEEKYIEGLL